MNRTQEQGGSKEPPDPRWAPLRFRLQSKLHFKVFPLKGRLRHSQEEVLVLGWRRTTWGLGYCIQLSDGTIQHGYDPATVELL